MKRLILALVLLAAPAPLACYGMGSKKDVNPGPVDTAPDFTLKNSQGVDVSLAELRKKGPVVLAFFPKAFTGG